MKLYDKVKVIRLRNDRFQGEAGRLWASPKIGDHGTVVEVHVTPGQGYQVEAVDASARTVWVAALYPDELAPVSGADLHAN